MNFVGRVTCTILGFIAFNIPGAILGFIAGYLFDRARENFRLNFNPEVRAQVEEALFTSIFPLMGCMAKADGRVCEGEIKAAEGLMDKMQLSPDHRQRAIQLFQDGVRADYNLDKTMDEFLRACSQYPNVKQILLVYLIGMAMADGVVDEAEAAVLKRVALHLGYSEEAFEHLLRMSQAQEHFHQGPGSQPDSRQLDFAYEALGVSSSASDSEVKRAYRKLMSEYHPDKLMGQGVPEEVLKVATERSQEIQRAYEQIKQSRKKAA